MTKEFDLSELIIEARDTIPTAKVLFASDVKEFIARIKSQLCFCDNDGCKCKNCSKIDKLAGDKLI